MNAFGQLQEQFKELPGWQKWLLPAILSLLILFGYYYLIHQPKNNQIEALKQNLANAQQELTKNRTIAARLSEFKAEVEELGFQLKAQLTKLPSKKEIPELLRHISGLGVQTGLEFTLFKPTAELNKEFYEEIPVEIEVFGEYHQVAKFLDQVSKLPRIVNITNLNMGSPKTVEGSVVLKINCLSTTYRSLDSNNNSSEEAKTSE